MIARAYRLRRAGAFGTALALAGLVLLGRPAAAATSGNQNVTVQVTAGALATLGVSYSGGSNITCAIGNAVTGVIACSNSATLSGLFRSSTSNSGGASVTVTGANITGSGGSSIPPSAIQMTCTGGVTSGGLFQGSPGSLANATPLSSSATTCQTWTGALIGAFSLTVSLAIDSSQVPADTYTATNFTAVATVN